MGRLNFYTNVSPVNVSSSRQADVQLLTEVAELVEKKIKYLDAGFPSINLRFLDGHVLGELLHLMKIAEMLHVLNS